jgi:hypothetical protein
MTNARKATALQFCHGVWTMLRYALGAILFKATINPHSVSLQEASVRGFAVQGFTWVMAPVCSGFVVLFSNTWEFSLITLRGPCMSLQETSVRGQLYRHPQSLHSSSLHILTAGAHALPFDTSPCTGTCPLCGVPLFGFQQLVMMAFDISSRVTVHGLCLSLIPPAGGVRAWSAVHGYLQAAQPGPGAADRSHTGGGCTGSQPQKPTSYR